MKNFKNLLFVALFFVTATVLGQTNVTGIVVDATNQPLPGASVVVKGTTNGTSTDFDGKFTLKAQSNSGTLVVSFIGYKSKEVAFSSSKANVGTIQLEEDANSLDEIVIVGKGVVDLAFNRKTPVAVSTIKAAEIQNKLGNQEFPEILNSTPGVYATKTGGGYGDGTMRVRGFGQVNTAVIINGQPVNDMENGRVFWSNWQGLADVASGIQMQRGLGASKLAVPSVGGTMTIVTKSTEKDLGGSFSASAGNDGYYKTTIAYNTGVNDNGWAASILLGRWQGDGYVDGTAGEGYTYLVSLGYKPSEEHAFNFTFTGAAQWHHQRTTRLSIRDYQNFGGSDEINRRFNADWGTLNGDEYTFRRNFYNKPIGTLNWDWNINDNLSLSTSVYGSWGRGGGTGSRGRNFEINPFRQDLTNAMDPSNRGGLTYRRPNGTIDFDGIVANNRAGNAYSRTGSPYNGSIIGTNTDLFGTSDGVNYSRGNIDGINTNVAVRRSSINSHDWYGAISNLQYETNEWTYGAGIDLRGYTGYHYRVLNDLLGLDGYYSTGNRNLTGPYYTRSFVNGSPIFNTAGGMIQTETYGASPLSNIGINADKIDYYNIGHVNWFGFNGFIEYDDDDKLSAVLQFGISNQSYKRTDYFDSPNNVVSEKENKTGGYIKGGANYNFDEKHNAFFNIGRISRQPFFDAIFPNFSNNINEDATNEKITSFELGYGFKSQYFDAIVNLYTTEWSDRFISRQINDPDDPNNNGTGTFQGLTQVHSGIEVELTARPLDKLTLKGMLSLGNWKYKGNVTANIFDQNQNLVNQQTLFVDGTKVGDAAQTTASLEASYDVTDNFDISLDWRYAAQLYSDFSFQLDKRQWANDAAFLNPNNRGALELPSYSLFNLGAGYNFDFANDKSLAFRFNINNLFDTIYIAEGSSSIYAGDNAPSVSANTTVGTYKGIDTRNQVWFGFGRTWNFSVRYNF